MTNPSLRRGILPAALVAALLHSTSATPAAADPIYSTGFNDLSGWTSSSFVQQNQADSGSSSHEVAYFGGGGTATLDRTIDTTDYENVTVDLSAFQNASTGYEGVNSFNDPNSSTSHDPDWGDFLEVLVDYDGGGDTWVRIFTDDKDLDGTNSATGTSGANGTGTPFSASAVSLGAAATDNPNLQIRIRAHSNQGAEWFAVDDLTVAGDPLFLSFTSASSFEVGEGTTDAFATLTANDPEGGNLTYTIEGGVDAGDFNLDPDSGELSFVTAPDFDNPDDDDSDNDYQLSVRVTSDAGAGATVDQDLTVTVLEALPPGFTTHPADLTVNTGDPAGFTVAATGSPAPTLQWEISLDGGATWSAIPGETAATLNFEAYSVQDGEQYRVLATNGSGSATSNVATLTVGGFNIPAVPHAFQNDWADTSSANDESFAPGQLLYRSPIGQGRLANLAYHNGFVYTNQVAGSGGQVWAWNNPDDVRSFTKIRQDTGSMNDDSPDDIFEDVSLFNDTGNHGNTKIGDYLGGTFSMNLHRVSPLVNAHHSSDPGFQGTHPDWINTPNDHQLYWPWGLAFNWIQYSSDGNGTAFVRRLDNTYHTWDSLASDGVTGKSILVGNILLVCSDDSHFGILAYDIAPVFETPAQPPVLLDKLSVPTGAYLPVLWRNYIILSRRDINAVDVVDYSDPTNLQFVDSISTFGNPDLNAGTNVPYVQCQDEFIFTRRHKIDMETRTPVLEFDEVGDNRPDGPDGTPSETGLIDVSQYTLPVGQFLVTGPYSFSNRDALGVWAHQADPDTRAPFVGYHIPRAGETNYPTQAPITLLIHETLESYTIINGETIVLRPAGGGPVVDCYTSFSHDDHLTLTPKQPLADDTTYEVFLPQGGIKDAAGNGIDAYSFTFSTGSALSGGNLAPEITSLTASPTQITPGTQVAITATATDPEGDPLEYKFAISDGAASPDWVTTADFTHTFTNSGHFEVKVQVRDMKPNGASSIITRIITLTVSDAVAGPLPTSSGPLALDETGRRIWTVNPDNQSLSEVDADSGALLHEFDLSALVAGDSIDPRGVALDANGKLWVTCHDADGIAVLDDTGALVDFISTGYGSAPIHVTTTPDGTSILVTLEGRGATDAGNGQIVRYDTSRNETGRLELGPMPRAIAVVADGSRALVSRFISAQNHGEIWEVALAGNLTLTDTIHLARDRGDSGFDKSSTGAGVPNYIASITITPDGDWAWYTGKKDQTEAGEFFADAAGTPTNSELLTTDHTVRAVVGRIDLATNEEPNPTSTNINSNSRIDVDNSDSPTAVAFSPLGDYAFVALQGNNQLAVYDVFDIESNTTRSTTWRVGASAAPQGTLIDPTTGYLWVKNFMSRDLTRHDMSGFFATGDRTINPQHTSTVGTEKLGPSVLSGKTIFYHASDRMSLENYISCASCHVDGMHDGRVFDFTQRGEGLRNTTDLRGRGGIDHGPVHWSGNFDEIEDFILDIMNHFGGDGFLPPGESPNPPLGALNGGRSQDLDDLAAYVSSLKNESVPKSPYRESNGSLTADAQFGATLFNSQGCASCHSGDNFTDSALNNLHDLGTLRTSSGDRLDAPLTGIDTPTLLGAWAGAPFFHDGQAETLADVFTVAGGEVVQCETGVLNGGAFVPNFIDIRVDGSVHGDLVELNSAGDGITFNGIDGGAGGMGAIEFRYRADADGAIRVTVNAGSPVEQAYTNEITRMEWRRMRFEDISLFADTSNTITVEKADGAGELLLDDMTVSRPDVLALAEPHRKVLDLNATEQQQMIAYIRQIDGRDAAFPGVLVGSPSGALQESTTPPVASYELNLATVPAGNVSVTVSADAQSQVSLDGIGFSSSVVATFSDTAARTIHVRAVDDAALEGDHTTVIGHAITASSDPADYPTTLPIVDASLDIVDNDLISPELTGGGSTSTIEITVPEVPDRVLVVAAGSEGNGSVSGATFADLPLIEAASTLNADDPTIAHSSVWYLVDPPDTTANLVVEWGGSTTSGVSIAYYVLSGIDQTAPLADWAATGTASQSGTPNVASVDLDAAPANAFVIDSFTTNNNALPLNWGSGQTEAWSLGNLSGGATHGSSWESGLIEGTTQTVSWSGADRTAYTAAAFNLAAGAPPSDPYDSWASDSGLDGSPGKEDGFGDDPEGDKLGNGLEWVFDGDPLGMDAAGSFYQASLNGGGELVLTFPRVDESEGEVEVRVEYSTDMFAGDVRHCVVPLSGTDVDLGNDVTATIVDNGAAADTVTIEIGSSNALGTGRLFGRIRANKSP